MAGLAEDHYHRVMLESDGLAETFAAACPAAAGSLEIVDRVDVELRMTVVLASCSLVPVVHSVQLFQTWAYQAVTKVGGNAEKCLRVVVTWATARTLQTALGQVAAGRTLLAAVWHSQLLQPACVVECEEG